mgnify:CR=1 FL=1
MRRDTGAKNEIRQIGRLASRGEFLMRRFFHAIFRCLSEGASPDALIYCFVGFIYG